MTTPTASNVIIWENGQVMVFDNMGQQIGELQGRYTKELCESILKHSTPTTKFEKGIWEEEGALRKISREEFSSINPSLFDKFYEEETSTTQE